MLGGVGPGPEPHAAEISWGAFLRWLMWSEGMEESGGGVVNRIRILPCELFVSYQSIRVLEGVIAPESFSALRYM